MAGLIQVALCTADMPRTIRTLVDVFGFSSAGGRPRWGTFPAGLQELPSGDDTSCILWWMLGRQEFVQVELFHHVVPAQRPRRPDWSPADLGWTRFGVTVADFDAVLVGLDEAGYPTITEPIRVDGQRRVCFRESGSDVIVEIIEDDEPTRHPGVRPGPAVTYAAVSVSDLAAARGYFAGALGFEEIAPDALHRPEHEALWGLAGAECECAVFQAGDVVLEVSRYVTPVPKPPPADALLSDQGFMNVAMGYRDRAELLRAREAAESLGARSTAGMPDVSGGFYLRIVDDLSVEMVLVPKEFASSYGFEPQELAPPGSPYMRST
ncbi:MAG: VOC family protein [Mycobacterium sp.]